MSACLILALPYFNQPFVLGCDVLRVGIGSILVQNRHLIAFDSWKLRDLKRLYAIYNKDMLTIMHALAKFIPHLVGGRFGVWMDHNIFWYFLETKDLNERKDKWVSKI